MQSDAFHLTRFVEAQHGIFDVALAEIRSGRKTGHWMWFIFPQLAGLGSSSMARRYAIGSLGEARAYLDHALLGPRLRACADAVCELTGRAATEVFGSPDNLKLRSSLTLFEATDPSETVFGRALDALCGGMRDAATLRLLHLGKGQTD